jgi:hypothetical protein
VFLVRGAGQAGLIAMALSRPVALKRGMAPNRWMALPTVAAYAAVAAAVVVLPGWLHGARPDMAWAGLAAFAAGAGSASPVGRQLLRCLCAIGLGLAADFTRVPPLAIATLCGDASGGVAGALLEHVQLFPVTSAAMVLMVMPGRQGRTPSVWLILALGEGAAMLLLMPLAMLCVRAVAPSLSLAWSPEAWLCAMAMAMMVLSSLHRPPFHLARGA